MVRMFSSDFMPAVAERLYLARVKSNVTFAASVIVSRGMIVRKRDSKHSCIRWAHRSNHRVDDVIVAATTTGTISVSTQTRWSREVRFLSIILIVIENKGGLERKLTTSVWDSEVECRAGCAHVIPIVRMQSSVLRILFQAWTFGRSSEGISEESDITYVMYL